MKKILIVCTGNTFRSWSAELLLRKYLDQQGVVDVELASAGTKPQEHNPVHHTTIETLQSYGIEVPEHTAKKVTAEDLETSDLVIAMADYHLTYLHETFNFQEAVLFNSILTGIPTSVLDQNDVVPDFEHNVSAAEEHIRSTVMYLHDSMPKLWEEIDARYFVFLDFVTGAKKVNRGYPVILLHENEYAAAFMSVAIPEHENAHILVVPKRRYMHLHSVPLEALTDIMKIVKRIGKVFAANYEGYNVLLNNGTVAEQFVFHVHFHVIPRMKGDGIAIQQWKARIVSESEFVQEDELLKRLLDAETDDIGLQSAV